MQYFSDFCNDGISISELVFQKNPKQETNGHSSHDHRIQYLDVWQRNINETNFAGDSSWIQNQKGAVPAQHEIKKTDKQITWKINHFSKSMGWDTVNT